MNEKSPPPVSEGTASARRILRTIPFAALLAFSAQAQTYVGAAVGYGTNAHDWDARQYPAMDRRLSNDSATLSVFVGERMGAVGIEAGAFTLPKYRALGTVSDYAAYAGRSSPEFPRTAQIEQTMRGTALYARGQVYAPDIAGFTPFAFAGVALAFNQNHEHGFYNGVQPVQYAEKFRNESVIYGAGVLYQMCDRWSARLEYLAAPGLMNSEHTLRRDVGIWSIGLAYQWGAR